MWLSAFGKILKCAHKRRKKDSAMDNKDNKVDARGQTPLYSVRIRFVSNAFSNVFKYIRG